MFNRDEIMIEMKKLFKKTGSIEDKKINNKLKKEVICSLILQNALDTMSLVRNIMDEREEIEERDLFHNEKINIDNEQGTSIYQSR